MNTKKLIDLVEKAFGTWEDEYCLSEETAKGMNEIIVILQRNGKFEEMWEELREDYGEYNINFELLDNVKLEEVIDSFKQKYFPKDKVIK